MEKYIYDLMYKIDQELDLRPYAEEIADAIESFGGLNIVVHERRYSFYLPNGMEFDNGMKRMLGRKIAEINGIGRYAYSQPNFYRNGRPAKATHLFLRSKEMEFESE